MTAQELRASLLQEAVTGRLVPQRAEEGSAEALYEEIRQEKARLAAEKKIKKEKPLPPVTEEEQPFPIPASWKWVRLADLLHIERGGSPRPIKDFLTEDDNGINWIKIGDTDKNSKYISQTKEKIISAGIKKSRFVHKGDLLLSNSMSFGRPYILNIDGCIHDGWLVLHPLTQDLCINYLYYLLCSSMVHQQFCHRAAGAVVNNLNIEKVSLTAVPLPPLTEQKRIVDKLEELLPLVDAYEEAEQRLAAYEDRFPDALKRSLLQEAITGRLVPQRAEEGSAEALYEEIRQEKARLIAEKKLKKTKSLPPVTEEEQPFPIPATWKWVQLGELLRIIGGVSYKKTDVTTTGLRILRGGNIQNGKIILESDDVFLPQKYYNSELLIQSGDIVVVASSGSKKVIGKAGYVRQTSLDIMVGAFLRICRPYLNALSPFLHIIFESQYYRKHIRDLAQGTNINNVKASYITELIIPLPPLAEQKRIVDKLEELLALTERIREARR